MLENAADLQAITLAQANQLGVPAAALCAGAVVLAIPGGGALEMPASVARDAAAALSACAGVGQGSCWECRHMLVCVQAAAMERAMKECPYLDEEQTSGIWQAVAGACLMFSPMESVEYAGANQ